MAAGFGKFCNRLAEGNGRPPLQRLSVFKAKRQLHPDSKWMGNEIGIGESVRKRLGQGVPKFLARIVERKPVIGGPA